MTTTSDLPGGAVFTVADVRATEYLPNRGVWLAGILGKHRGDAFGLYDGHMEPGCEIAREIHPDTSETVWILEGDAVGIVEGREVPLRAGQVMHVAANKHHGLRNVGTSTLHFIVIGHPDF